MIEQEIRQQLIESLRIVFKNDSLEIGDCWKASSWKWKVQLGVEEILYTQVDSIIRLVDTLRLTFIIVNFQNRMTILFLPMEE